MNLTIIALKKSIRFSIVFIICFLLFDITAKAQQDTTIGWKSSLFVGINFNQVKLSNWAMGGQSAVSGGGLFNGMLQYDNNKIVWLNRVDLGYGIIKAEDDISRKTEDKINLYSKFGKYASKKLLYTAQADFKTQFDKGYNFPNDSVVVSRFMAPGFLLVSLGLEYRPRDNFSIIFSPVATKTTFVRDQVLADSGAFGVDPAVLDASGNVVTHGKKVRFELGALVTILFKKNIMPNVALETKLDLFNSYADKNKSNRKNIDVSWETQLNMKVNKYIGVNIFTHLIHDNDIDIPVYKDVAGVKTEVSKGPRTQFKEVFGLGFTYKI